jgi:hypothetical protein
MKAASLISVILCFPALLSPQQITPMNIAAPADHPGQKMLMLNHHDLLLTQLKAWQDGYELARDVACETTPNAAKESCEEFRVHVEPETGTDSETIRLHLYYRVTGRPSDRYLKSKADTEVANFLLFTSKIGPKWLKWERRDNGDAAEALK